ncbi:hypothetical protein, partial [Methanosarcina mazei]|uniref:hypothetical protein n=1 Tax=Methanosarcina mazei TaxID=2209 RepID=UPI001F43F6D5
DRRQRQMCIRDRIKIFKVKNEEARVHFIPTLKDGVFVTLCAPLVRNRKRNRKLVKFSIKFLNLVLHVFW